MKTRICLILLSLMFALSVCGCQRSAATTESQAVVAQESSEPKPKKPVKPAPPKNEYKVSWEEKCSVDQAFSASARVLEDLGLGKDLSRTQTVRVRNPRTGKMESRRVSASSSAGSDGLSASLKAKTTAGVEFQIGILLVPADSTQITINASSTAQPKDILKQQSNYLKQQISEAIQNPEPEAVVEPASYPQVMVFERTVDQVYKAIYNDWIRKEGYSPRDGGRDKFYREIALTCASGIDLTFKIRLIDENKTKLEIEAANYEGKEEFNIIIQRLVNVLQNLKEDQAVSKTTYAETTSLDYPIFAVYEALMSWAKGNSFSIARNPGGDAFYKYLSCHTTSGIDFSFRMRLIDVDKTKLEMTVGDQKGKEEYPMILKSLAEALENIEVRKTVIEETVKNVHATPTPQK